MDRYVELYEFISAPLNAILEAERMAHDHTLRFLKEYGIDEKTGALKHFTFHYKQPGTGSRVSVKIPILSLIPIPNLQIKEAEINFDLNLLYEKKTESTEEQTDSATQKDNVSDRYKFRAAITNKSTESSQTHMNVKIKMEQADIPNGLSRLFQIMDDGTSALAGPDKDPEKEKPKAMGHLSISSSRSKLIAKQGNDAKIDLQLQFFDAHNQPVPNLKLTPESIEIFAAKNSLEDFNILLTEQYADLETDAEGKINLWLELPIPSDINELMIKISATETDFMAVNAIRFQVEHQ